MTKTFKKTLAEIFGSSNDIEVTVANVKKRQVEAFEPLQAIDPTFLNVE